MRRGVAAAAAVGGALSARTVVPRLGAALVEHRVERRFNVVASRRPPAVSERARELHRRLVVADLHADSLLYGRDFLRRSDVGHVDVPRLVEGNVAIQALAACVRVPRDLKPDLNADRGDDVRLIAMALGWPPRTWTSGLARALHVAARARRLAAASGGRLAMIASGADLDAYLERRRADPALTAGVLTIEGAAALDGEIGNVGALAAAGYRLFAPIHMADNAFGGSATGVSKGGLTSLGRELIPRLEAAAMLVDVAHASERAVDEMLGLATRPVVASHTGLRSAFDVPRNLPDEQVRAVARSGGVVGVGFWPGAVGGDDVTAIVRSIVRAIEIGGVDHVALGSDFDGAVQTPFDAAGLVQLTDGLLAAGLDDDGIAKVMGGNVVRLLAETLPAR